MEEFNKNTLEYQLSEQNSILVVSFVGQLIKANLGVLEMCKSAVLESKAGFVVLNFRKAEVIDIPGFSMLIQIQQVAREKPAKLRLCFLEPTFSRALDERGGLRRDELYGTLIDAVKSFDYSLKV